MLQVATIGPAESQELATAIEALGGAYLETSVLGSRPGALCGGLQVMVGGSPEDLERARPVLRELDPEPKHLGPVGSADHTKLALNQLIASLTHGFSLALHLVQGAGGEVEAFMAILRGSALHAAPFDKKLAKELADDDSNPNFPTAHLRKDLALFLVAARAQGLDVQGLEGLHRWLQGATAAGLDALDYSALHRLNCRSAHDAAAQLDADV